MCINVNVVTRMLTCPTKCTLTEVYEGAQVSGIIVLISRSAHLPMNRCPQGTLPRRESRRYGSTVFVRPKCEYFMSLACNPAQSRNTMEQQAYGEDGVVKTVDILQREIVRAMRLMGVSNVNQLTPELVSCGLSLDVLTK